MARKDGAKVTHHCWCGKSGWCRKHLVRCHEHGQDYYEGGGCKHCLGEAAATARRDQQRKQDEKKQDEEARKREQDEAWYGKSNRRK